MQVTPLTMCGLFMGLQFFIHRGNRMTQINIAKFKGDVFQGHTRTSDLTFDELKSIKEKNGVSVYEISADDLDNLGIGYEASLNDGIVSITAPDGWKHPDEIEAEEQARKDSVRDKLEALGLTTDEVKSAFGI